MNNETNAFLRQIRLGEDSALELKEPVFDGASVKGPHRHAMADELAAMANSRGGAVILGVNDKSREISGIPLERLDVVETWVRNIANDLIEPPLECSIRKHAVDDGGTEKYIIRIDVPRSIFVHKSPDGYFYRIGSSKREMSTETLARLFQQRAQTRLIRFDEQVVPQSTPGDLNPRLWQRFKSPLSPADDMEFLRKLKLAAPDDSDELACTVSGILMACDAPERFIPNAFIQAVCYRGGERNGSDQVDAKDIYGPLDEQIKEACKFVYRNMRVFAVKAPMRIDIPQYSMNAVFEAVTNAAAHRDYSIYGSKIRLHLFAERLELFSPGAIPNTMTIESLPFYQSSRNELLTSLLAKCPMNVDAHGSRRERIMDRRGEGVPIILSESEELSGTKPVYRLIDDAELMLTIYAAGEVSREIGHPWERLNLGTTRHSNVSRTA